MGTGEEARTKGDDGGMRRASDLGLSRGVEKLLVSWR